MREMRSVTVLNSLTPIKEVPKTITISQSRKVWPLGQVTHRTVHCMLPGKMELT